MNARLTEIETRKLEIRNILEGDKEVNLQEIKEELEALDKEVKEIEAVEEKRNLATKILVGKIEARKIEGENNMEIEKNIVEVEERAFANFIKSECGLEKRAGEQNFTMSNNGAVIPTTIINRIVSTVKEMCPILAQSTMYNIKGTLKIPVWGLANTTHDITVAYQSEFTDITADSGKLTSVDLTGYLAGALTLVGKSVINSADVDVVSIIVNEMSKKIALFLEKELLVGTSNYATGALSTTTTMNAGSTSAITADNLIYLQAKIPQVYQASSAWTMAPATFTAIRKLKDGSGQYLLQPSLAGNTPFTLLGKPVYLSENMPAIGSANKAVLYGDYSGLAVNMRENISIQILMEKYATMHAVGIVSWFEFDSKVADNQKLATLVMSV